MSNEIKNRAGFMTLSKDGEEAFIWTRNSVGPGITVQRNDMDSEDFKSMVEKIAELFVGGYAKPSNQPRSKVVFGLGVWEVIVNGKGRGVYQTREEAETEAKKFQSKRP